MGSTCALAGCALDSGLEIAQVLRGKVLRASWTAIAIGLLSTTSQLPAYAKDMTNAAKQSLLTDNEMVRLWSEADQILARNNCRLGNVAILDENRHNLPEHATANGTCTAAQKVTADNQGNEAFYEYVAQWLKQNTEVNLSAKAILDKCVSLAASNKGRAEAAIDAGFTVGYEPDSAFTKDTPHKTKLLNLAASLTPEQAEMITKLAYDVKNNDPININGLVLPEVVASVIAGVKNGQAARAR